MKNLIWTLFVLTIFVGCKAKHKIVNKEKTKIELSETVEKTIDETTVKTTDSTATSKTTSVIVKENEFVDVVSDSTGIVTIEEVITPQGKKLVFTGAKSVSIGKNKVQEETEEESKVELAIIEETEKSETELTETDLVIEESKKVTEVTKVGLDPLIGLGIGLGVVGLLVLWYIRRKKRLLVG